MKTSISLSLAAALSLGFASTAMADYSMHHVYRHHYKSMHKGSHLGHRQPCVGQTSGTAHRSCGTRTGGPAGGLH